MKSESFDPLNPKKLTTSPSMVGASVIGLKYNGGVLLAADRQISYGSYKCQKNVDRIFQISENTAIASTGEYADATELVDKLRLKHEQDMIAEDGHSFLQPKDYCTWLARIHYERRNKGNPYWNFHIVGGVNPDGEPFLGSVDLYGTTIQENDYLVSGFANYFCNVLLTNAGDPLSLTEEQARAVLNKCYHVLLKADRTQGNMVQFCKITSDGVSMEEPTEIPLKFDLKYYKEVTNEIHREMTFYV